MCYTFRTQTSFFVVCIASCELQSNDSQHYYRYDDNQRTLHWISPFIFRSTEICSEDFVEEVCPGFPRSHLPWSFIQKTWIFTQEWGLAAPPHVQDGCSVMWIASCFPVGPSFKRFRKKLEGLAVARKRTCPTFTKWWISQFPISKGEAS